MNEGVAEASERMLKGAGAFARDCGEYYRDHRPR